MAAMASNWMNKWKYLKIFFKTTGWIETNLVKMQELLIL